MKIIDETGIVLTTEPDLEAGYLVEDVEVIHHDAVEGTAPQWHRETAKLPDGSLAIYYRDGKEIGRDMVKVIDVPGVDPQPAWDEEVPVMRYIRYTADELAAQAEAKKKAEEAAAAEAKKKGRAGNRAGPHGRSGSGKRRPCAYDGRFDWRLKL